MKPVVFLVHGMGRHEDGWHEGVMEKLDGIVAANNYSYFTGRSVADVFEFVPLGYDGILSEAVGRVEDSAQLLQSLAPFSSEVAEFGQWIENSSAGDKEFIWTHAMDVILYRLHTPTRQLIRTTIVEAMATKVDEVLRTSPLTPVSILAHSLGTAVAHDAAHLLGHQSWGGRPNPFGPNHWRFSVIAMLANVSRLLESDIPVADSIVRPGAVDDGSSYCTAFLNYRHEYDPVPWLKSFATDGFEHGRTEDAVVTHFHEPNIHGWGHYLVNPQVHVRFLREALGDDAAVTLNEEIDATLAFEQWGGRFAPIRAHIDTIITELPADLKAVIDTFGQDPSLKDIAAAITGARRTYDKYKAIVEDLEGQL